MNIQKSVLFQKHVVIATQQQKKGTISRTKWLSRIQIVHLGLSLLKCIEVTKIRNLWNYFQDRIEE